MPILVVYGLRPEADLARAYGRLQDAVAIVPELHVTREKVEVFFCTDLNIIQQGQKLVAILHLFEHPDRTDQACARVAHHVSDALLELFPRAIIAECHSVFMSRNRSDVCIRSSHIPPPD